MTSHRSKPSLVLLVSCCMSVAAQAQYQAVILNTPQNKGYAYGAGGGQRVGATSDLFGTGLMWTGSDPNYTILRPDGYSSFHPLAVSGGVQVGYGGISGGGNRLRALACFGSNSSFLDLDIASFASTRANGVHGNSAVGFADTGSTGFAILWNLSTNSYQNLHPAGYIDSNALGVYADTQVGYAGSNPILWHGTAASAVNLRIAGTISGRARAVWGDYQYGSSTYNFPDGQHAIIWHGSATDFVDLNLPGNQSNLNAANASYQVGSFSQPNGNSMAARWQGTAQSVLNLHQFIPDAANYFKSFATGIDEDGTIVGYANSNAGPVVPIMWVPVPEPSTLVCLLFMAAGAHSVRRKRLRSR